MIGTSENQNIRRTSEELQKRTLEIILILTEEASDLLELKNELITIPDSLPFNFNLKSITENGIDLLYYYRIGLYLNQIELAIDDEISGIHPRNVVTGLIKGTGIAHLFSFKKNQKFVYDCKKARNFYLKSKRTYLVYRDFSMPSVMIVCAKKVTASKLLKFNNDAMFENFVGEIRKILNSNGDYKNYFDQSDTLQLFELFENRFINNIGLSYDIIKEVIRYTKNPSLPIEKQITVNPMFEKEFK
ncbi:hypothetical protein RhiirA5_441441 [Rhizophagus irregularis]|uniref:Uncharacterized protein n=1 Tax=Rhizophagus irregularis TaxID=588596 RepID=A0A2N0NFM1_9GLOM|nr:hypothetical protein RhiirA5_441441 [Rhizophagus irregularis]